MYVFPATKTTTTLSNKIIIQETFSSLSSGWKKQTKNYLKHNFFSGFFPTHHQEKGSSLRERKIQKKRKTNCHCLAGYTQLFVYIYFVNHFIIFLVSLPETLWLKSNFAVDKNATKQRTKGKYIFRRAL